MTIIVIGVGTAAAALVIVAALVVGRVIGITRKGGDRWEIEMEPRSKLRK